MATDNLWGKFRRWRRHRPFWGGLFLILSAVELYISANMTLGGLELHLGPQGFLSYLIPLMLLIAGLLIWFTPAQRLFYAIIGLLAALYSFVGLNLGGFFFGMLLGIIGGALVIAWTPRRPTPGAERTDEPPTGSPSDHDKDLPQDVGDEIFGDRHDAEERRDADETQRIEIAGHDDRPHEPVRPAGQSSDEVPPEGARPGGLARLGRNPKTMVLAIVPLAVTATILVAGSNMQASAAVECPPGLPSATATATTSPKSTAGASAAAAAKSAAESAAKSAPAAPAAPAAKKTTPAAGKTTAAPTATATDGSGNAVLDGIGDFFDGVGNLLGINNDETSSPSTSPTPSDTATPTKDPEPTATATTTKPAEDGETNPTTAPTTGATPTTPASVLPAATGDEIPCLGARQEGLVASADDIPLVAAKPGLMEVDSLTMHFAKYDGVVDMPVQGGGSYKALKFSMQEADNEPFKLSIDEPSGAKTVITSKKLVTKDNVKFYTPEFKGNLFGVIPVTFTPDSPPPIMLDFLWFTKAKIQLAYVRCDTLTGKPLKVAG